MAGVFRIRPAHIVTVVQGTVLIMSVGFTALFLSLILRVFADINTASTFFGSANVIMYVTIESLFLFLIFYATYIALRKKEFKD